MNRTLMLQFAGGSEVLYDIVARKLSIERSILQQTNETIIILVPINISVYSVMQKHCSIKAIIFLLMLMTKEDSLHCCLPFLFIVGFVLII